MTKVSVIIPAYNAEKMIERTLKSLIDQTIFASLEIIVVDDGSTDKTGEIIDRFAEEYGNIRAFHQENKGVSAARNLGIGYANGIYIGFVDADDIVDPNYYEKLFRAARDNDADITATGFTVGRKRASFIENEYAYTTRKLDRDAAVKAFLIGTIDVHVFTKIYKKRCFKNLKFDESLKIGEDRIFNLQALIESEKVSVAPGCGYHYAYNPESVTSTIDDKGTKENLLIGSETIRIVSEKIPSLLSYAECTDLYIKCRLLGNAARGYLKKDDIYDELKSEVRRFSLSKARKHSTSKHYYSLLIIRLSPKFYALLRRSTYLRYKA